MSIKSIVTAAGLTLAVTAGPAFAADPFTTARGLTSTPISMVQSAETFTTLERVQAASMTEQELRDTAGMATAIEYGFIDAGTYFVRVPGSTNTGNGIIVRDK